MGDCEGFVSRRGTVGGLGETSVRTLWASLCVLSLGDVYMGEFCGKPVKSLFEVLWVYEAT